MTPEIIIAMFVGLFIKHFIVDFPLQVPYHYLNKGTYFHPGGVQHAMWHGYGTAFVLFWFTSLPLAVAAALFDTLIHYHVDWAKMNLNKKLGYTPTSSEKFWWLLGLDQLLHMLTYAGLVWMIVAYSA